jgi:hypothetical protein
VGGGGVERLADGVEFDMLRQEDFLDQGEQVPRAASEAIELPDDDVFGVAPLTPREQFPQPGALETLARHPLIDEDPREREALGLRVGSDALPLHIQTHAVPDLLLRADATVAERGGAVVGKALASRHRTSGCKNGLHGVMYAIQYSQSSSIPLKQLATYVA